MNASLARIWGRYVVTDSGCWEYSWGRHEHGYGRIRGGYAHRVAWMLTHGPIPKGMHVCHRCDNPPCINPDHLFLGTHRDNMEDRLAKSREPNTKKTHCIRGHAFTPENTSRNGTKRNGEPGRYCRTCANARKRAARRAQRWAAERGSAAITTKRKETV